MIVRVNAIWSDGIPVDAGLGKTIKIPLHLIKRSVVEFTHPLVTKYEVEGLEYEDRGSVFVATACKSIEIMAAKPRTFSNNPRVEAPHPAEEAADPFAEA